MQIENTKPKFTLVPTEHLASFTFADKLEADDQFDLLNLWCEEHKQAKPSRVTRQTHQTAIETDHETGEERTVVIEGSEREVVLVRVTIKNSAVKSFNATFGSESQSKGGGKKNATEADWKHAYELSIADGATQKGVGEALGVSTNTAREWIKKGKLLSAA